MCARVFLVGQLGLEWAQAMICHTRVILAGWLVGVGADMAQEHSGAHHCRAASVGRLCQVQASESWSVPYWDYFGGMAGMRISTGEVPGHTMPGPPLGDSGADVRQDPRHNVVARAGWIEYMNPASGHTVKVEGKGI